MKDFNEVLSKLSANRIGCPKFVLDELERLYEERDQLHKAIEEAKEALRWGNLENAVVKAEKIINEALGRE